MFIDYYQFKRCLQWYAYCMVWTPSVHLYSRLQLVRYFQTDRLRQTSATGPQAQAASSPSAPWPLKALRWPPDTFTCLGNEDPLHTSPCTGHKPGQSRQYRVYRPCHHHSFLGSPAKLCFSARWKEVFLNPESLHIVDFIKGFTSSPQQENVQNGFQTLESSGDRAHI